MPINQDDQDTQDTIDVQQYWLILKRRWLPISVVIASVISATAFVTYTQKPVYESQGKMVFTRKNTASFLASVSDKVGELGGLTSLSNPVDTEAEVIRSNPIIIKTISELRLKDEKGMPMSTNAFLAKLKLKTIRGTDVMEISYRSSDNQQAANIVNSLMKYYLESNILTNRAEAVSARKFLSQELPRIERQVIAAEIALRRFKENNRVVLLDVEARVSLQSLANLSDLINQSQGELAAAYTRSLALQNEIGLTTQQAVSLSTLSQSPGVQQILTEYQKTQHELAIAQTIYTKNNPKVVDLLLKEAAQKKELEARVTQTIGNSKFLPKDNLQIGELKQALTQDLVRSEVQKLALTSQVRELQKVFMVHKSRLDNLPRLEQQQLQLQRQLTVAQITYQELLKQFQLVQVMENQNIGNARIISPALVPEIPISPRKPLNLALGGFLGVLLGAGTAILLESMNQYLKNVEEANRLLGFPILGIIPLYGDKKTKNRQEGLLEVPLLNQPYSPVSTSLEMLNTNLGFTVSDKELQVILVTSTTSGEGKSFVAANLAAAASHVGKQVLLIDADMRRPRQHRIWEIPNLLGMSNILAGQNELKSAIHKIFSTVDMLPAGKVPPNPVTLLDSQRMANLIEEVRKDYNFVVIDSPPLTAVTDPLIISKFVDGLLLVIRPGQVEYSALNSCKSLLNQSKAPVLGMVVNAVGEESGYGGYYYYRTYKGYYRQTEENSNKNNSRTYAQ